MNDKGELDRQFSLPHAMRAVESFFIAKALKEAKGSVTRAARILGVTHQRLCSILKTRHRELLEKRKPIVPRKQSIIQKGVRRRGRNFQKLPTAILAESKLERGEAI